MPLKTSFVLDAGKSIVSYLKECLTTTGLQEVGMNLNQGNEPLLDNE